jgi:hypothetical protein
MSIERRRNEARWWFQAEVGTTDPTLFDPHYVTFIQKVSHDLDGARSQGRNVLKRQSA